MGYTGLQAVTNCKLATIKTISRFDPCNPSQPVCNLENSFSTREKCPPNVGILHASRVSIVVVCELFRPELPKISGWYNENSRFLEIRFRDCSIKPLRGTCRSTEAICHLGDIPNDVRNVSFDPKRTFRWNWLAIYCAGSDRVMCSNL